MKKFIALLMALLLVLTVVPAAAYAEITSYDLTIVNKSNAKEKYIVEINDSEESIVLSPSETKTFTLQPGDTYSVKESVPDYYKLESSKATFKSGDVTREFTNGEWKQTFCEDLDLGQEYHIFSNGEDTNIVVPGDDVALFSSSFLPSGQTTKEYAVVSTAYYCSIPTNGVKTNTATISYKITGAKNYRGALSTDLYKVTTKAIETSEYIGNTSSADWLNANFAKFKKYVAEEFITSNANTYVLNEAGVTPKSNGSKFSSFKFFFYQLAKLVDVSLKCPLNNIEITFESKIDSQADFDINVLNLNKAEKLDKINNETITDILADDGLIKKIEKIEINKKSLDSLISDKSLQKLAAVLLEDNIPQGIQVKLNEVDLNDGYYEGKNYNATYNHEVMTNIDFIDVVGQVIEAKDYSYAESTYNSIETLLRSSLVKQADKADLMECIKNVNLPITLGVNYGVSNIKAGTYDLTINALSADWGGPRTVRFEIDSDGNITEIDGNSISQKQYVTITLQPFMDKLFDSTTQSLVKVLGLNNNPAKLIKETGLWYTHQSNKIVFSNKATSGKPIVGSKFELVNRDQFLKLTTALSSLGLRTINGVAGGIEYKALNDIISKLKSDVEASVDAISLDQILLTAIELEDRLGDIKLPEIFEATSDANGLVTFDADSNVSVTKIAKLIYDAYNSLEDGKKTVNNAKNYVSVNNYEPNSRMTANLVQIKSAQTKQATISDVKIPGIGSSISGDTIYQFLTKSGDKEVIDTLFKLLDQIDEVKELTKKPDDSGEGTGGEDDPDTPTPPTPPVDEPTDAEKIMEILAAFETNPEYGKLVYAVLNMFGFTNGMFPCGNYLLIEESVPEGYDINPVAEDVYIYCDKAGKYVAETNRPFGEVNMNEYWIFYNSIETPTEKDIKENIEKGVEIIKDVNNDVVLPIINNAINNIIKVKDLVKNKIKDRLDKIR